MALTNASRLADFGPGIGTQGAILQVDNADQMVGIGTTDPTAQLEVKPVSYTHLTLPTILLV